MSESVWQEAHSGHEQRIQRLESDLSNARVAISAAEQTMTHLNTNVETLVTSVNELNRTMQQTRGAAMLGRLVVAGVCVLIGWALAVWGKLA